MRISIDGGLNYLEAENDIRVIYGGLMGENDELVELHINLTYQGVIMDVWPTADSTEGSLATSCEVDSEIVERLLGME